MQNYQIDSYPTFAASSMAAVTLCRSIVGGLLPLSGLELYDVLGSGWGTSLLAFILMVFIPVPVCLYYLGERLRKAYKPVL
jgi:hypothetical protein